MFGCFSVGFVIRGGGQKIAGITTVTTKKDSLLCMLFCKVSKSESKSMLVNRYCNTVPCEYNQENKSIE